MPTDGKLPSDESTEVLRYRTRVHCHKRAQNLLLWQLFTKIKVIDAISARSLRNEEILL